MSNPLDEFERFSYNAGEDDLKPDFQLIEDPIWSFREKDKQDNDNDKEKGNLLDNLDKSPLNQSQDPQQHHLSNLFSQNWNNLQTVSPQQVSLDWTPTQSTSDFPQTSIKTSSPATAALANFNENKGENMGNVENLQPLFKPKVDSAVDRPHLSAFNSSSSDSDEETSFNSVQQPTQLTQPKQPTQPSPPSPSSNTHKRPHAETHSHPHTHSYSQSKPHSRRQSTAHTEQNIQSQSQDVDKYTPPSSPGYESSEDEYDDSYGAQPTRQRRRQSSTSKTQRNQKIALDQIDTKHIPYAFELTDDSLVRCTYSSPVPPHKKCKTSFQRPYDLARHVETIHSRDEAQLVRSGKISPAQITIPGLAKDLEEAEKDPKKAEKLVAVQVYKCDGEEGCGYVFSRKDALIRHKRIRGHGVPKQS
ncbi:hypothetical protein E3P81_00687 [Wallemia ichthyophaga]|nr:hypothetical protein E3P97_00688 [Wallemia ichthyophaga]TIB03161.1 hypothetical protein E3P96_01949 [Wallemia ichthyophaga]TIB35232.1 hypothetical protein E3P85_00544 [Wallemia ichthyophaga]TIB50027.1 hypothetical protein E3P82_00685 [Wallemia ichthyophaga]TIB53643.1 hypothetical protein E3P81_00687 [Wallemia ichthyophaga]